MTPLLIVFAKAPLPGTVKTRMAPLLGAVGSARLHQAMVRDTIESLLGIEQEFLLELHTDRETEAWTDLPVPRRLQTDGDLGVRMGAALSDGLRRGHPRVLIVGSDAPALPAGYLIDLLESASQVALGPTEDGGYYAIACSQTHPDMFAGVSWSTPSALEQTMLAAKACGLSVALGRSWFDLDEPSDLQRLAREVGAPHTKAFLRSFSTILESGLWNSK